MSHNLTEVDTFSANVTVPDGGDPRTAASVETPLQALANRTKNLNGRLGKREQIAMYTLSGTGIALGGYATLTPLDLGALDDGYSLTDTNRRIVPPDPAGLYRVLVQALITLNSALVDDAPYLRLRSNTSGPYSVSKAYGANCPFVTDRTFVHNMEVIAPGDVWLEFNIEASTSRTATFTAGSLLIERIS